MKNTMMRGFKFTISQIPALALGAIAGAAATFIYSVSDPSPRLYNGMTQAQHVEWEKKKNECIKQGMTAEYIKYQETREKLMEDLNKLYRQFSMEPLPESPKERDLVQQKRNEAAQKKGTEIETELNAKFDPKVRQNYGVFLNNCHQDTIPRFNRILLSIRSYRERRSYRR